MGDQPSYADPIIIPITITIPDPRPQPDTDRWGQLGRSTHPSFDDTGGRQEPAAGLEAVQASAMQRRRYDPLAAVLPDPPPSRLQQTLDAMLLRAEQRAADARGEIEQGDYGSAAGHLLLGRPFPANVDDPPPPIVHNEAHEEDDPPAAQPGSDVETDAAAEDKHPSTPIGRRSLPVRVPDGTNQPTEIGGRGYTGHSLDQMQSRGVPPSAVEDAIRNRQAFPGNTESTTRYVGKNRVTVVTNATGGVITVINK